ncbi:MAG: EAL and HDOD domain-containing protein [Noviherbaspirillum sp.]
MQEENFLVREPLLNTQERVLGYELTWQRNVGAGGKCRVEDANELVRFVAAQVSETSTGSLLGEQVLFLDASPELLTTGAFSQLPPKGTVLALHEADLTDEDVIAEARALRAKGYGISLRNANLATVNKQLLPLFTYIEASVRAEDFATQLETYRALELPMAVRMVARDVSTWEQYDFFASQGVYAFVGQLHLTPRPSERARDLSPQQTMILQLMKMVKNGDDVRQLESVLKRDAALSYKLLRYINSAGFSLGCEIQSLKHAVTLLGYSPLYRWLALLLTTATTSGYSPVLMQAAVIRGRFVELLGHGFLPKNEAENLFVAGMFSLLDRLLGVPMEDVLEKIPLSEAVSQALLARQGIYGPFLALAEACELNLADVESMATSLCISANQVNQAQLSALAWVQGLTL